MRRALRAIHISAGLAATWAISLTAMPAQQVEAQTWRTMTSERQVWDTEPLDVQIRYGAGTLSIRPAEAPTLYRMELRYDNDTVQPDVGYDAAKRVLRLAVHTTRSRRSVNVREGSTAAIALTRQVPLDLDLEFGAGKAEIDLGGISLRRLAISTGASETAIAFARPNLIEAERVKIEAGAADLRVTGLGNARAAAVDFQGGVGATVLDFGGEWTRDMQASVQMGVGSVTIRLPRAVGVRINRSSFLSSFNAPGMERQGNSYQNAAWANATRRITIDLSAALGSIDVQWID